jgi:hypothetical protein
MILIVKLIVETSKNIDYRLAFVHWRLVFAKVVLAERPSQPHSSPSFIYFFLF